MDKLTEGRDSLIVGIAHSWEELECEKRGTGCDSPGSQNIEWRIFQLRNNLDNINTELAQRRE